MDPQNLLDRFTPFFTDHSKTDLETYRYMVSFAKDCASNAGVTCLGGRRIDYIFVMPKEIQVDEAMVLKDKRLFGMDHKPVLVSIREETLEIRPSPCLHLTP